MKNIKREMTVKIAHAMLFPSKNYLSSPFGEEAIYDILINTYGEDYKSISKNLISKIKNFNRELAQIQFTLLKLIKGYEPDTNINILYIGSDPMAAAFSIVDTAHVLLNISSLSGWTPLASDITFNYISTSKQENIDLNDTISYLNARLNGSLNTKGIIINELKTKNVHKWFSKEKPLSLIIVSDLLYLNKNIYLHLRDNLKEGGALILLELGRANCKLHSRVEPVAITKGIVRVIDKINYAAGDDWELSTLSPCSISKGCLNCHLYIDGFNIKSKLVEDFKAEDILDGSNKGYVNFLNEWLYAVLLKKRRLKTKSYSGPLSLDEMPEDKPISFEFHIVSQRTKQNKLRICDGSCGPVKYSINTDGYPLSSFKFGDYVRADNVVIKRNGKDRSICFTKESKFEILNNLANNTRLDVTEIDERALRFLLKRFWSFDDYREGQLDIIKNALLGISTLGILPTGAGKSLCFQLPAIIKPGISIVVSPLKSLMKDQVDHLKNSGFDYVAYLDSSMNKQTKSWTLRQFKQGTIKLLYVSPERLQIKSFQDDLAELLKGEVINYFVIDEAHCASEWGHDFRPAYLKIKDIVNRLGNPTVIALTATASNKVLNDIVDIFGLDKDNVILPETFDRPEISFEVITTPIGTNKDIVLKDVLTDKIPKLLGYTNIGELHQRGSGIVFTVYADPRGKNTKMFGTEYIKEMLDDWGLTVERYHSKLDDEMRIDIQDKYIDGEIPLLVSTKGFGMGIDKGNIRYIIHMCFSNSLEAYYQEAGRCGRNKEHAHVVLLASKRHPNCIKNSSLSGQPRCIKRWDCSYTGGVKCDYGMQAKFICDEYGKKATMKKELNRFIDTLIIKAGGKQEFSIEIEEDELVFCQKYLFYLQKESVVKDYVIIKYLHGCIEIQILLDKGFNRISTGKVVRSIVNRLQGFKRQKLNMLESIWNYVQNENVCRRNFLMNYFGDNRGYEKDCGFCDIDGFNTKALGTGMRTKRENLYKQLNDMFKQRIFSYDCTNKLINNIYAEGIQENIKIRAMRHLEDYPNNEAALYITGIITLRRNREEAYGHHQLLLCLKLLENKDKTKAIKCILQEVALIDEAIVKELLDRLSAPYSKQELIKGLYNSLEEVAIKDYIYLRYVEAQLSKVNNMLKGAIL